jgi:hypothetical protein
MVDQMILISHNLLNRMQTDYNELKENIRKNLAEPNNEKTEDNS